jgi:hypothetical protein
MACLEFKIVGRNPEKISNIENDSCKTFQENFALLRSSAALTDILLPTFRDIISVPFSRSAQHNNNYAKYFTI